MVVYAGSTEFTPPTPGQVAERNAARARVAEDSAKNEALQAQRTQAPASVTRGSPQDIAVRAEAARAEQQRMVSENVNRIGSSQDSFRSSREEAINQGFFNYGKETSAFYSPPPSYLNSKGETVSRSTIEGGSGPAYVPPATFKVMQPNNVAQPSSSQKPIQTKGTSPTDISAAQLAKTDALREKMGLPRLEDTIDIKIVGGTGSTAFIPAGKQVGRGPADVYRSSLSTALTTAQSAASKVTGEQGNEVASFLKTPFSGNKVSSPLIPSTSMADILQFLPLGIGMAEKGVGLFRELSGNIIKDVEKPSIQMATTKATQTGTKDIGTNISKYTERFKAEKNMQDLIREKALSPTKDYSIGAKESEIKLGTGTGRFFSSEGSTGSKVTDTFSKPPPSEKSEVDRYMESRMRQFESLAASRGMKVIKTEKGIKTVPKEETEKTTSAGKGLEQIVKEKQEPNVKQTKTEQVSKTKEPTKTEQIQKVIQKEKEEEIKPNTGGKEGEDVLGKMGMRFVSPPKSRLKLKSEEVIIKQPTEEKTTTGGVWPQETVPPGTIPILTGKTGTRQTTKQEGLGMTDMLLVSVHGGPPSGPPSTPPPPEITPPPPEEPGTGGKKNLDVLGTLGGSLTGGGGRSSSSSTKKNFIGNVPIADIVGIKNREEISYNQKTIQKSDQEVRNQAVDKFVKSRGKGKIL